MVTELEPVALTTGVKVCDFDNSSVADCNSNSWPGYRDASYTSVQPIRSSRFPQKQDDDTSPSFTCTSHLGTL